MVPEKRQNGLFGGHFVYANQMVKNSKFRLGTGFIGFVTLELW